LKNKDTNDTGYANGDADNHVERHPTQLFVVLTVDPEEVDDKQEPEEGDSDEDALDHEEDQDGERVDEGGQVADAAPTVLEEEGQADQADQEVVGLEVWVVNEMSTKKNFAKFRRNFIPRYEISRIIEIPQNFAKFHRNFKRQNEISRIIEIPLNFAKELGYFVKFCETKLM
jgi:hypothetical protein